MNRYVNIGLGCGLAAVMVAAVDLSAQAKPQTAKPATEQQAGSAVNLGIGHYSAGRQGRRSESGSWQPIRCAMTETPATPPAPGQTPQSSGGPNSCAAVRWSGERS